MSLVVNYSIWFGYNVPRHHRGEGGGLTEYCTFSNFFYLPSRQLCTEGAGTAPCDVDSLFFCYILSWIKIIHFHSLFLIKAAQMYTNSKLHATPRSLISVINLVFTSTDQTKVHAKTLTALNYDSVT
jgi:hypothetical protein